MSVDSLMVAVASHAREVLMRAHRRRLREGSISYSGAYHVVADARPCHFHYIEWPFEEWDRSLAEFKYVEGNVIHFVGSVIYPDGNTPPVPLEM